MPSVGSAALTSAACGVTFSEVLDIALERIGRRLKIRSSASSLLVSGDLGIGRDVGGIDDRHIEPGLHAVVEHDRVQHRAGLRGKAKGDVAHAERGQHAGQVLLDQPDAFDRLDRGVRRTPGRRWRG